MSSRHELSGLLPDDLAQFVGEVLVTRKNIQLCLDAGQERAEEAVKYLRGDSKNPSEVIQFYVGHIGDPRTRAIHILKHVAFKDYVLNNPAVRYDELNDRFLPKSPKLIDLNQTAQEVPALYRVEDHHDLDGTAGVVSYLSADLKEAYDLQAVERITPVGAAKRLIAEA